MFVITYLDGGNSNIFGIFTPNLGEMIQFDYFLFLMGWNHQLDTQKSSNIWPE